MSNRYRKVNKSQGGGGGFRSVEKSGDARICTFAKVFRKKLGTQCLAKVLVKAIEVLSCIWVGVFALDGKSISSMVEECSFTMP